MSSIPKQAYVCWPDKSVIHSSEPLIRNGLRNLIDLNPDWTVTIFDDADIDYYLKNILHSFDYALVKDVHIVEKSDLWRLFKMYREGGLYMDIDRFYNIPMSEILDENTKCLLPTCLEMDFSQDFMCSEPGNPIYKEAIDLVLQRRREGHTQTYLLGPQTYMHAVTKVLCGVSYNTDPGLDVFTNIRYAISNFGFIKTYREYPPYDTIVYRYKANELYLGEKNLEDWDLMKRDFYVKSNIGHWTWTKEQLQREQYYAQRKPT